MTCRPNLSVSLSLLFVVHSAAFCRGADSPRGSAAPLVSPSSAAEFRKLEAADDAAQAEVDGWVRQNNGLKGKGGGVSEAELERRIAERWEPIRKGYEDYLQRHPNDARAHLVYGSFLNDRQDEHGAQVQWEKALALDPANPVVYNNLAGRYSESGPVEKAFEYFAKAVELAPAEPAYYHNFGDSLYVLRKRAAAYYHITEQEVFGKSLVLYSNALRLDPTNFVFARDLAQTFYSMRPFPAEAALSAWTNALRISRVEADRQDVCVHLARVKMLTGHLAEARSLLKSVTNAACLPAKISLLQNMAEREKGP